MFYKPDIEKTIERQKAYWQREIVDRCCVTVWITPHWPMPDELGVSCHDYYFDVEVLLKRWEHIFNGSWFGGDALPVIFTQFGVCSQSLYFGGEIECRPDTIWFEPCIKDWDNPPEFNPDSPWIRKHEEIVQKLAEAGEGRFFVSIPDNPVGIMDTLANLRGPRDLLCDMLDYPDQVKQMTKKITQATKDSTARLLALVKKNNLNGAVHPFMHVWAPGSLAQLQCDLSVMISPQMYEEFVLPELEEFTGWLDYSIYHLDGQEQIKHLDHILSVKNLNAIQWTPVAGQPFTSKFIPVLQRIQAAGKNLILFPQPFEVEELLSNLSSKGLILNLGMSNREEAEQLVRNVAKWTRE